MTNPNQTPLEQQFTADAAAVEQEWQQFKPIWDGLLAEFPVDWEDTTK